MIIEILAVIAGLVLLVWSADRFVDGAAALAKLFGMSPLMIGMIVIGFGTSMPEMLVSATSALQNNPQIALGNAYGSNIVNIGLVLGIGALFAPIAMPRRLVFGELSVLVLITLCCFYWLFNHQVSRLDSIEMLIIFALIMTSSIYLAKKQKYVPPEEAEDIPQLPLGKALILTLIGLVALLIAAEMMVWGAVGIAHNLGVSDLVIGLTIVALGTSLPELASTIAAARKNNTDLAFGNIIGSNIFNTLAVVGIAGVIKPFSADPEIMHRDLPVMVGFTLLLFLLGLRRFGRNTELGARQGICLFVCFLAYTGYLIYSQLGAASHG